MQKCVVRLRSQDLDQKAEWTYVRSAFLLFMTQLKRAQKTALFSCKNRVFFIAIDDAQNYTDF